MKLLWLLVLSFFCSVQVAHAYDAPISFTKKHTGWMKLLSDSKQVFLVSGSGIEQVANNKTVDKATFTFNCNDAVMLEKNILLATDAGIKIFNTADNTLHDYWPAVNTKKITHVMVDPLKHVWFTSEFEGCFMIDDTIVQARVTAPVIYSLAVTPDSNIWVGTNIGLYKISLKEDKVSRYAEEGIEGLELPDNLVERLFADDKSNLWVLMPEQVAFIPGENFEDELPVFNHVGSKANTIYSICAMPPSPSAYLFATAEGIIYISALKADAFNHTGEIHRQINQTAFLVADDLLAKPAEFKDEKILLIQKHDKHTWFITAKGLWKIKTNKLVENLEKQFPKKPA